MAELRVVDEAERERIRRGLRLYKKMHRIGDPALSERMENRGISVDLRTLQRFIAGTHRTEDIVVRRYRKFLAVVAPPPVADKMGAALASFLGMRVEEEGWLERFPGTYRSFAKPYGAASDSASTATGGAGRSAPQGQLGFTAQCSILKLEEAADPSFLRARELLNEADESAAEKEVPDEDHVELEPELSFAQPWVGNTGAFVPVGLGRYLLMVRSLTELRIYDLRLANEQPLVLHGYALQPESALTVFQWPEKQRAPVREIIFTAAAIPASRAPV